MATVDVSHRSRQMAMSKLFEGRLFMSKITANQVRCLCGRKRTNGRVNERGEALPSIFVLFGYEASAHLRGQFGVIRKASLVSTLIYLPEVVSESSSHTGGSLYLFG